MPMRFFAVLFLAVVGLRAEEAPIPPPQQFMADYARLLRAGDREALIRLYAPNGTLIMGDGFDDVASLEQTADLYRNHWSAPTAFAWRDLQYRQLDPTVVAVTGGFDWTSPEYPRGASFSYHAVLVFHEDKWRIRSELEFEQPAPEKGSAAADGAVVAGCPFCEIAAGTRQGEGVVYRDARVIAFLSIGPRNPGHLLIVPIAHADGFTDVPAETMHAMTDVAKRLVAALSRTDLRMDGYNLQMNTGKAAGQSVFHAHLHLIPRFVGEPAAKTPEERVGMEVLAPIAAKIRTALADTTPGEPVGVATASNATGYAIDVPYDLPAINTEVPLERIREICGHYGLHALWRKIEKDPPSRPFKSDGCTGWFDDWKGVSLYPAGFLHDLKYWAGYPGEDVERLIADAELMTDVARLLKSTTMAETMFHGVRVGGAEQLKASFSWGFGRAK